MVNQDYLHKFILIFYRVLMVRLSIRLFCFLTLVAALVTGCQKDESVKKTNQPLTDSIVQASSVNTPGSYLANKGTLTVKVQDSTYTFNAEQDSIAFVNIVIDSVQYYGLTAINKAHTVSFGISSSGMPIDQLATYVSGCQLLQKQAGKNDLEYTLIRGVRQQDFGTISIEKYNQDTTLAKGTFHTFLSTDVKAKKPASIVDGSFELKVK